MKRYAGILLGMLLAAPVAPALAADNWPSQPIRFVVPFPPGGPTDLMARLISEPLSRRNWAPASSSRTRPAPP